MKKLAFLFIALSAWQFSMGQTTVTDTSSYSDPSLNAPTTINPNAPVLPGIPYVDTCVYNSTFPITPVSSNNQPIGIPTTDIYPGVDYVLALPTSLKPTSVKLNGVTLSPVAVGSSLYKFNSPVAGTFTFKLIGSYAEGSIFSENCRKFSITFPITINPLGCGYAVQKIVDLPANCLTDQPMVLQVDYKGTGLLMGYVIRYDDGSTLNFSANETITLMKNPEYHLISGFALVTLPGGTVCQAPFVNSIPISPLVDADPRFELSGSLEANTPFDVYFIGQPSTNNTLNSLTYNFQVNYGAGGIVPATAVTKTNLSGGELITSLTLPAGDYKLMLVGGDPKRICKDTTIQLITIGPKETESCASCFTFKPQIGKRYWASAWVKVETPAAVITYPNVSVKLNYKNASGIATGTSTTLSPTGNIIDGWQRIAGEFTVPAGTIDLQVQLVNTNPSTAAAYFDDLRIHPFNASMKSYVYDPTSFLLVAELDDNNYATYYEYDKEGQLIRIKKETEKGVMTIQESRSSNPKKQ